MPGEKKEINSWIDRDYYKWVNTFEPDYWFGLSVDKEHTTPEERKFLYELGKLSSRGKIPSIKQLRWAKSIADKIKIDNDLQNKREKINKGSVKTDPLEITNVTVRMAWHDNKWNGRICLEPEKNDYCIGEYSLLSRRIRQRKK